MHEAIVASKRADNVNFTLHWTTDHKKTASIVQLLPLGSEEALPFQVDQTFLPLIYEIMTSDGAEFRRSVRLTSLISSSSTHSPDRKRSRFVSLSSKQPRRK